jgi:hypothetical protein
LTRYQALRFHPRMSDFHADDELVRFLRAEQRNEDLIGSLEKRLANVRC